MKGHMSCVMNLRPQEQTCHQIDNKRRQCELDRSHSVKPYAIAPLKAHLANVP